MTYTVKVQYITDNDYQVATFDNRDDAWRFMREIDATDSVIAGYPQPANH